MEEILKQILSKVTGLETKFDGLEKRFDGLENKFDGLEKRFDGLENKFNGLEKRFDGLEAQVAENTQILKALEHKAEINKAEHDLLFDSLAKIEGKLERIVTIQEDQANILDILSSRSLKHEAELKSTKRIQIQVID